jgi:hypothetical protein
MGIASIPANVVAAGRFKIRPLLRHQPTRISIWHMLGDDKRPRLHSAEITEPKIGVAGVTRQFRRQIEREQAKDRRPSAFTNLRESIRQRRRGRQALPL